MFAYYGSKRRIVGYYPPPKEKTIIEPFAGSAQYALKYWDREVFLYDKYDKIIKIWKYLQQASKQDILNLPDVEYKMDITQFTQLCDEERWLLAYFISRGAVRPDHRIVHQYCDWNNRDRKRVANDIFKIKHWNIELLDYKDIENKKATWFIDPPYERGGDVYHISNKKIDFKELGTWCKNRNGHIIVCENSEANWLPFLKMATLKTSANKKTIECIWSNFETGYNHKQLKINL